MRKSLAILLCLLSACATNNEIRREYYSNGNIMIELPYKDGKANGIGKSYNEDGSLFYEVPYKNGKKEGIRKTYREDGTVDTETLYKDDSMIWTKGYYNTGKLNYYKDADIGRWYFYDGSISEEYTIKNEKKHGILKNYEPDGSLTKEIYYEEDVKIWQKEYNEYENLVKETSYYYNGDIWTEAFYEDGKKILKKNYDEDGNLRREDEYKDDKIVSFKTYKADGSLDCKQIYNNDGSIEFSTFLDKGVLMKVKTKYFDDNKEVEREEEFYINDSLRNIYKYDENDILIEETGYTKNGKEKDYEKYYYEDGNLKREILFKNGIQIGEKEYDKDGNIIK